MGRGAVENRRGTKGVAWKAGYPGAVCVGALLRIQGAQVLCVWWLVCGWEDGIEERASEGFQPCKNTHVSSTKQMNVKCDHWGGGVLQCEV